MPPLLNERAAYAIKRNNDGGHLEFVLQTLDKRDSDRNWLRCLCAFLPVSMTDSLQLQAATGFSRDQINRILKRMERAAR